MYQRIRGARTDADREEGRDSDNMGAERPTRLSEHTELILGTSGWSYPDWRRRFYPKSVQSGEELRYYSNFFSAVEVNMTYYRHYLQRGLAKRWYEETPDDFLFAVKMSKDFTHKDIWSVKSEQISDWVEQFLPLGEKLAVVLIQLPQRVKMDLDNLVFFCAALDDRVKYAIEFRDKSWLDGRVFEVLMSRNISWVSTDNPVLKRLLPNRFETTCDFAYVRFHGRNAQKWYKRERPSDRYHYHYPRNELQSWREHLYEAERDGRLRAGLELQETDQKQRSVSNGKRYRVFGFFNNHPNAFAVANAIDFMEVAGEPVSRDMKRLRDFIMNPRGGHPFNPKQRDQRSLDEFV